MRKINSLKKAIINTSIFSAIILLLASFSNSTNAEDPKNLAEEHNDAKFNNGDVQKDAQFLVSAAEINLGEIQLGQLAQKNSKAKDVNDLGKMMEAAHRKSQESLTALASKKSITIPVAPTNAANDTYNKISGKAGSDFDNAYCNLMVDGHKDAISIFEKAATDAADEDIRKWAGDILPELRAHLDKALNCQKSIEKNN